MDCVPTAAEYLAWRREQLPDEATVARLRADARAGVAAQIDVLRSAVMRSHGLMLPESLFTFMAFWRGLTHIEQSALEDYVMVRPLGLLKRLIYGGYDHMPKGWA